MRERRLGDVINLMIADHSSGGVRVTSQQLVLVLSPTKGGADIIMQEDFAGPQGGEDSRAEIDNVQRKIRSSLTLNMSDYSKYTFTRLNGLWSSIESSLACFSEPPLQKDRARCLHKVLQNNLAC